MIIVELKVIPLGTGKPGLSEYVAKAVEAIRKEGITPETGAMGTVFEAKTIDRALEAVKKAHQAMFSDGAKRVVTFVEMDERRDKEGTISRKKESISSKLKAR